MNLKSIAGCGDIFQIAYVVDDLEQAVEFWAGRMGAGPFFLMENIAFERITYRGRPAAIDISVAIGYWGDMQIELIRQNNDAPSIYSSWKGQQGVHHMCVIVDDIKAARASFLNAGAEILQEGNLNADFHFFYADTGGGSGTMIEAITAPTEIRDGFEFMKAAARDWDGLEPLRKF